MAQEVKRKKGETFESLLRRFNRRMIESGKLFQARKIRFMQPTKSKTQKKAEALHKIGAREHREYLRRIGKLDEFEAKQRGRKRRR